MEIVRLILPFQSETTARRESVGDKDLRRFESRPMPSDFCGSVDDDSAFCGSVDDDDAEDGG
jgi:hypothetical protein